MSTLLTVDSFEPYVQETFQIIEGSHTLDIRLTECKRLTTHAWDRMTREPFSLVFTGPMRPVLPQRIYRVRQEAMGELELFLVPIGPGGNGMQYESVFT